MNALIALIESALQTPLFSEPNESVTLKLVPGMSEADLAAWAAKLPCPMPPEIGELLRYCRGIEGLLDIIDFSGEYLHDGFGLDGIFPHAMPIAHDGYGNYWLVDLSPDSRAYGPIWFACHDAPVMLYQCAGMEEFLRELFRMHAPPFESALDDVHEDRLAHVWEKRPHVQSRAECLASTDLVLRSFAESLPENYVISDLRGATTGDGFAWGPGEHKSFTRCGTLPLWGYEIKRNWLDKLLGRK